MFPEGIKLNKLEDFNRIGIAFSGGLDSSVLLSFITENFSSKDKLYALHVNPVSYTHLTLPTNSLV